MFTKDTFNFLDELTNNNHKAWFETNKQRYESLVREPALEFITAMEPILATFTPHFRADSRKVGGSLMRVFRDTRFSRDKTPYKTNVGIHFRHELGKDIHAPGYYVHLANDQCFLAVGCWHPDSAALGHIRDLIASKHEKWLSVCQHEAFVARWQLWGDRLIRAPQGYDSAHPVIEDIKRKDFVGMTVLTREEVTSTGLENLAGQRFAETSPFMKFLCEALGVQY